MTKLSVNINKVATLRNARGGNVPNVIQVAKDCERFGADGITVHPRPDERHIRYKDVYDLAEIVQTEFNIEGYPSEHFLKMVCEVKPTQVTLVPDPPDVLTSNAGWDTKTNLSLLTDVIARLKESGIRTSLFVGTNTEHLPYAKEAGADRVELYTESYAVGYSVNKEEAIRPYVVAANTATELGLGVNAGHDLSLENLAFFAKSIHGLEEVSIGHALICDALYFGLENTVQLYLRKLITFK